MASTTTTDEPTTESVVISDAPVQTFPLPTGTVLTVAVLLMAVLVLIMLSVQWRKQRPQPPPHDLQYAEEVMEGYDSYELADKNTLNETVVQKMNLLETTSIT